MITSNNFPAQYGSGRYAVAVRRTPAHAALVLFAIISVAAGAAPLEKQLRLDDGTEIGYEVYNPDGKRIVLWLPSEAGTNAREQDAAAGLARRGFEVWMADILTARFLPAVRSSMHEVPAEDVVALVAAARKRDKPVYLVSGGLGASPALRGAALAQRSKPEAAVAGIVLWSPNLYEKTPEVGDEARYIDAVNEVALPIAILQAGQSPWRWRVEQLKAQLQKAGSAVEVQLLEGVRDRFHFRRDATGKEEELARKLPALIAQVLARLQPLPARAGTP